MDRLRLDPPIRGATDAQAFIDTPPNMAPVNSLRNMRPNKNSGRRQFSTRPGTSAAFPNTLSGAVQAMTNVGKSSGISGYTVSAPVAVTGGSSWPSGMIKCQALVLDTDWSVITQLYDSHRDPALANPPANYGGVGAYNCCFHNVDANIGYYLTITLDDTNTGSAGTYVGHINRIDLTTRAITHSAFLYDANPGYAIPIGGVQVNRFPNEMKAFGPYLFVAAGDRIYIFRSDDLTYINRITSGWAQEYQAVSAVHIGAKDYLLAAHIGSTVIAGPVVADAHGERFGEFYRSAIEIWEIEYAADGVSAVVVGGSPIIRKMIPVGLLGTDPGYEAHGTFRISEWSTARPRGALIYDFVIDSTGNAYIGRTSQGFGYNGAIATQRPDGTAPFVSVCKAILEEAYSGTAPVYIDPAAVPLDTFYGMDPLQGGWEIDSHSYRRLYTWNALNWYNDIPAITGGVRFPELAASAPSSYALAYSELFDRLYVGGVHSADRGNVVCISGTTGQIMWEKDVIGLVNQNAMATDPNTGNVVVGILRALYDGANKAELIELDRVTGAVVRAFDLGDSIDFNGYIDGTFTNVGVMDVAINSDGKVLVALAPFRFDV